MACIFCDILTAKPEATFVYRDTHVAAFMDIQPVNPGHVLVVPVEHFVGLADLPSDIGSRIFAVAQSVSPALRKSGLRCEGVNLFLADGAAAMQEVFHAHLHVFPASKAMVLVFGSRMATITDRRVRLSTMPLRRYGRH